ncbi:uncharacterized protein LOC143213448 isoform X3 [Lasioglossum baleicum]|uniref:uncharacterized protein LOC143213448 isoform X3 n=1 Tax=Lasioglossum baleicum TaxID=434251 RepID=UPI003FCE7AF9
MAERMTAEDGRGGWWWFAERRSQWCRPMARWRHNPGILTLQRRGLVLLLGLLLPLVVMPLPMLLPTVLQVLSAMLVHTATKNVGDTDRRMCLGETEGVGCCSRYYYEEETT